MTEDLKNYGNRGYDRVGRYMLCLGIIGMLLLVYSFVASAKVKTKVTAKIPLTLIVGCRECHKPEVIHFATIEKYKRFHQHPTSEVKRLAREMAEQERIVNRMMGINQ